MIFRSCGSGSIGGSPRMRGDLEQDRVHRGRARPGCRRIGARRRSSPSQSVTTPPASRTMIAAGRDVPGAEPQLEVAVEHALGGPAEVEAGGADPAEVLEAAQRRARTPARTRSSSSLCRNGKPVATIACSGGRRCSRAAAARRGTRRRPCAAAERAAEQRRVHHADHRDRRPRRGRPRRRPRRTRARSSTVPSSGSTSQPVSARFAPALLAEARAGRSSSASTARIACFAREVGFAHPVARRLLAHVGRPGRSGRARSRRPRARRGRPRRSSASRSSALIGAHRVRA